LKELHAAEFLDDLWILRGFWSVTMRLG